MSTDELNTNTEANLKKQPFYANWPKIIRNGLWTQNSGVVQMLGMCPVLAVSNSVINALALGLATSLVTMLSNVISASIRHFVPPEIRNPIFILIIAGLVTCIDALMNAYLNSLYTVLGIFIPLITTNCLVLARVEAFASKNPIMDSALDGLFMGLGLTLVLIVLGGIRELIGHGTLFNGAEMLLGKAGNNIILHIVPTELNYQFLLATLPPGAFFGLGFIIATKNALAARKAAIKKC